MSSIISKLIKDLKIKNPDAESKIKIAIEDEHKSRLVREIFKSLVDEYGCGHGYSISSSQCSSALGVSKDTFNRMIKSNLAPDYYRTSNKPKAPYRFYIVSVAEFLANTKKE